MAKSLVDKLGKKFGRASGLCRGPAEDLLIGGVDKAPPGYTDDDMVVDVGSAREIRAMLENPRKFFEAWADAVRRAYCLNLLLSILANEVVDPVNARMLGTYANVYEGRHRTALTRIANLLLQGKLIIPGTEAAVAAAREKRGNVLYDVPIMLDKSTDTAAAEMNSFMNVMRRIPTARDVFEYVTGAITRAETLAERGGSAVDYGAVLGSIGLAGQVQVATAKHWAELRGADDSVLDAMFAGRLTAVQAVELVKRAKGKVAQRAAVDALPAAGEGRITTAVVASAAQAATTAVADAKESGESQKAAARAAAKGAVGKRKALTLRDLRKLVTNGKGASAAHKAVRGVLDMLTTPPGDLTPEQIEAVPGLAAYLDETAPDAE